MGLGAKLNLVLVCVFATGLALFYFLSEPFLEKAAEEEVLTRARIMMEGAAGIRKYTAEEVAPLLTAQMRKEFHPQTVAAYAATKNFEVLRQDYPDYLYREAALNPMNPRSRAIDWEADIINDFRAFPNKIDLVTHRDTAQGRLMHLSRPIRVAEKCLVCHSRWQDAPKSLIAAYGKDNGFGWKVNETVGAQIVSVPMSLALKRAHDTRLFFIELLAAVFVVLAIVLNILMRVVILNPITRISHIAGEVSMGKTDVPECHSTGSDEIASLSESFNRMRRTVEQAMKMLSDSLKR
jgi:HAMP domain-containing protein